MPKSSCTQEIVKVNLDSSRPESSSAKTDQQKNDQTYAIEIELNGITVRVKNDADASLFEKTLQVLRGEGRC